MAELEDHDPLVALEGALNFRDLGGYRREDGRRIARRQVFRSDGLSTLTDGDLETLRGLGLRTVIDFRRSDERDEAPTIVWDHEMELLHLGVDAAGDEARDLMVEVMEGRLGSDPIGEMAALYQQILEDFSDRFRLLFDQIVEPERRPIVFHCTAGKDRTGVAAMLLLGALGIDRTTIVHDYSLTHRYRTVRRLEVLRPRLDAAGIDVETALPFLGAVPEVMERTLDHVDAAYGGVERYLTDRAQVDPTTIDRLRAALLVAE